MARFFLVLSLLLLGSSVSLSQSKPDEKISFNTSGLTYTRMLQIIQEKHGVRVFYDLDFFNEEIVPVDFSGQSVLEVLEAVSIKRKLQLIRPDGLTFIFAPRGENVQTKPLDINIKKTPDVIIASSKGFTKGTCRLSGTVTDGQTGLPIIGSTIRVVGTSKGTISGANGRYDLSLASGQYEVIFSALGFTDEVLIVEISYDGMLNMELYESVIKLSDIVISGEKDNANILNTKMGTQTLDVETIKKLPSLLGEKDIVKSVELLPGVTSVGEGSAGFNVRGGGSDQNLVLLQGSPVFNYSHFLGFFSAFNADVVKGVDFYRGYIPPEYGGRISSVLDISLRDGNYKKIAGKGGISLVSSTLLVEGPIQQDTTSFFLAGRGTYSDWVLDSFNNPGVQNSSSNFYDINAKITHKIDWSKQISANFYYSEDKFNFLNDTIYNWQTLAVNLIYQQILNKSWSLKSSLSKGQYNYLVEEPQENQAFELKYLIDYYVTSHHVSYDNDRFNATAGIQGTYYTINSGSLEGGPNSEINDFDMPTDKALDIGVFAQGAFDLSPNLKIAGGLRLSNFLKYNTDSTFLYLDEFPKSEDHIYDTLLPDNKVGNTFHGLEPRIGLTYILSEQSSIKASFTKTYQYIHLISNTSSITPLDIWQTSGYHIKPQIGKQYSLGYYHNLRNNRYETSAEVYYKELDNVLEYKNGAQLVLNSKLETDLLQGVGAAYGLEMLVKKNTGKLTGWASYTYSRTFTKVDSKFKSERISNGYYYPANYDKPHNLKIFGSYKFNHRITLNWNFLYSTGRPITVPVSKYRIDNVVINNFSARNQYRIPDYHRLDIAMDVFPNHKVEKVFESYWTLGFYNVYARKNAYSVFFEDNGSSPTARQLSVLGTIFPSISYNFKF